MPSAFTDACPTDLPLTSNHIAPTKEPANPFADADTCACNVTGFVKSPCTGYDGGVMVTDVCAGATSRTHGETPTQPFPELTLLSPE